MKVTWLLAPTITMSTYTQLKTNNTLWSRGMKGITRGSMRWTGVRTGSKSGRRPEITKCCIMMLLINRHLCIATATPGHPTQSNMVRIERGHSLQERTELTLMTCVGQSMALYFSLEMTLVLWIFSSFLIHRWTTPLVTAATVSTCAESKRVKTERLFSVLVEMIKRWFNGKLWRGTLLLQKLRRWRSKKLYLWKRLVKI